MVLSKLTGYARREFAAKLCAIHFDNSPRMMERYTQKTPNQGISFSNYLQKKFNLKKEKDWVHNCSLYQNIPYKAKAKGKFIFFKIIPSKDYKVCKTKLLLIGKCKGGSF